jgi:hypothetical protein
MTLFEYLAIAFSLVFSFAGMRLVGGIPHALQPSRRYWVHFVIVCLQLMATVIIFWNFFSFRNVTWTLPTFLLVLASPGLIYHNACALIPEDPSAVESWHAYYYSVRRRYFVGVICWALAIFAIATVVFRMPLLHPARAAQAAFFVVGVVGLASASERVHAGIVLLILLLIPILILSIGIRPGALAAP